MDPLSEDYVHNSPYAFAENRVIDGRELEGLEWVSMHDDKTNTTTFTVNMKVRNSAGLDESSMYSAAFGIASQIEDSFSGKGEDGTNYIVNIELDFESEVVDGEDYYLDLVEEVEGFAVGKMDEHGNTNTNRIQVEVGGRKTSEEIDRTGAHEVGHTANLYHNKSGTDVSKNGIVLEKDNLMRQSSQTSGTVINDSQRDRVNETVKKNEEQRNK